jgi:hypothetical protein
MMYAQMLQDCQDPGRQNWLRNKSVNLTLAYPSARRFNDLSFPKITSGRIDDVALPRSKWPQWRRIVGQLDLMAHLSAMPNAYALDCNTLHKWKESGVGAPRRRCAFLSANDPETTLALHCGIRVSLSALGCTTYKQGC